MIDALPRLFPIDLNDGHDDAKLHRRTGIVSTMLLVPGHDTRWATLAEAAANARATEHKAHVDGAAFKEADGGGNFPPDLFAEINNAKELAVKNAVEELGGGYEASVVPPETPNDDVPALVSQMRGMWRSQVTTPLKAQPAPQLGDDDGAVAHNDDDDDDRPVVHNDDDGDWAVAQLREQQQRRFAVEHQERGARHAKELVAAVKRREEAQGAAEPAEEWARQPHNRDIVRKGNYDEMMVELVDCGRIAAGAPGELSLS